MAIWVKFYIAIYSISHNYNKILHSTTTLGTNNINVPKSFVFVFLNPT